MAERARTDAATWLTAGVLLAALALRLRLCSWGLPYDVHWDEPQTAANALRMLKDGDPHPHFLRYGSLLTYLCVAVDAVVAWVLFGRATPPLLDQLSQATVEGWTFSHPSFLWANRAFVAAIGTLGIGAAAAHARTWGGPLAGLVAATFLAFLAVDAEFSAQVTPNAPMAALIAGCAAASARVLQQGDRRWLVLAFAAAGLAASFKYTGGVVAVLPLAAVGLRRDWRDVPACLVLPLCFLVGTPYALLDLPFFVSELGIEIRHYRVLGHPGATVEPGVGHLLRGLSDLAGNLGPLRLGALFLGLPWLWGAARQRNAWVLALFPLAYAALLSSYRVEFHRNWLPLYSFAAVAAGVGLARARVHVGGRAPLAVAGFGAAALVGASVSGIAALAPVREDARHALVAQLRRDGQRPGVPTELGLHPEDLARLPEGVDVAPLAELICGPERDVVVPARFVALNDDGAQWRLNALLPGGPRDGAGLWLDGTSPAVTLHTVRNRPRPATCGEVPSPPLTALTGTRDFPRNEKAIFLVWAGTVSSPPLSLPSGRYEVAWRLRGTPTSGVFPTWEARAAGATATGEMTEERGEAALRFEAGEAPVVLSLAFTNDAAVGVEDRNLEVHGLSLRRLDP